MLFVNHFSPTVLDLSDSTFGSQTCQTRLGQETPFQCVCGPFNAEHPSTVGLETDRDMAGASLSQLMDALSAAIVRNACISGDQVLMALAEAAVLERELSGTVPRRWRVQQALDVLLKMGPHVTAAVTAVLDHPQARAQITCVFSE